MRVKTSLAGFVTETVAGQSSAAKMAHGHLVCPPPVSPRDHQARRLALCALHAQLSRRRRFARGARSGYLLRNGAAMGFEVRTIVRQRTSPATPATNDSVASRRDGRDDCGPAVLAMARGRRRRRGSRSARAASAQQGCSGETDAQAAQETRLCTRGASNGQTALLRRGEVRNWTVGSP